MARVREYAYPDKGKAMCAVCAFMLHVVSPIPPPPLLDVACISLLVLHTCPLTTCALTFACASLPVYPPGSRRGMDPPPPLPAQQMANPALRY